jgi:type IV pilus assembly protein PilA
MMRPRDRGRRNGRGIESGFTLVELMIAITVAGILMAIAAFSLIRARASANEASAIASLSAVNTAQISYNAACGRGFFAASLPILGMPPHEAAAGGYIDSELATAPIVERAGYAIRIQLGAGGYEAPVPDCNGNDTISAYYATARPLVLGETGSRAFATNQVGTIWQSSDGIPPPEPFGPPAIVAK